MTHQEMDLISPLIQQALLDAARESTVVPETNAGRLAALAARVRRRLSSAP